MRTKQAIIYSEKIIEPRHVISKKCIILTNVDSDERVLPPFKVRISKRFSVSSLTGT